MMPLSSMHRMLSVEDCTTLFSSASRRRMPMAYDSARQVWISSERSVAALNSSPMITIGAAHSISSRWDENPYSEIAPAAAINSASTPRLRRQFAPNSSAASAAQDASNSSEVHRDTG